jgi:oligosaccharide repeat unit polymerase
MLELLLCITLAGLAFASTRRMGFGNPFQIYFLIWFGVILGYSIGRDSYIPLPAEFLLMLLAAKGLALALLAIAFTVPRRPPEPQSEDWAAVARSNSLRLAQLAVICAAPFAYLRATELAGSDGIFSVLGYMKLRLAMTEDGQSFGVISYFSVLTFSVSAVVVRAYFEKQLGLLWLLVSVVVSLFYTYLSTGRTFVLLFLIMLVAPLVVTGLVRIKGVVIALFGVIGMFTLIAAMTAKGVSAEEGLAENLISMATSLRSYTVAPLLAFYRFVESSQPLEWGINTFRFFYSILIALGMPGNPPPLIREYVTVPDLTNVYTVYEVYFRDYSQFGLFIPPLFLVGHWWLYRASLRRGGPWVFLYSTSLYPLVMQFFQDQYMSLLSMWIQVAFWFWLLLRPGTQSKNKGT